MKRKLFAMAVIFTLIISQFTLVPLAESDVGYMSIHIDGNLDCNNVLSGHDIKVEAVGYEQYGVNDPVFKWKIEEVNVAGSSITPGPDGHSATVSAGNIVDQYGNEPTLIITAELYSSDDPDASEPIARGVYETLRVSDEYYDIIFDGFDPDKLLPIGDSMTFTCYLYRYNNANPSGELISGSNVSFNPITYENYDGICSIEQSADTFKVTRLEPGYVYFEVEATIDGSRYNTSAVYFSFPGDCELYFGDGERHVYSDGDLTLNVYPNISDGFDRNLSYEYEVKIIEGVDPSTDEYIFSELPGPAGQYFTNNGDSITLHGAGLWGATANWEGKRLYIRAKALYSGTVLAAVDTDVWVRRAGFSTGLEYLEEEKTLIGVPEFISKDRKGQIYGADCPDGEEVNYTVTSIERDSGTATIAYDKNNAEWRIVAPKPGKSVFRMTLKIDRESASRTAYFTIDAVEDKYTINWTEYNEATYAFPGDKFELAVDAAHKNYKDPDKDLNDYSIEWSVEGDAKDYVTFTPNGKKAAFTVDSNIADSVFDDGETPFVIKARMIPAHGDVVGPCEQEYVLTNLLHQIVVEKDEYKVPVNGKFTISPKFIRRSYANGATTNKELDATYTFDYDKGTMTITDGQGKVVSANPYSAKHYTGPFTVKRLNEDAREIKICAWNLDIGENYWSMQENITLNELYDIDDAYIEDISAKTYNGKEHEPVPVVHWDGALTLNNDYTVSYENNTDAGTATVTVTGIGDFYGTKTANFTIKKAANPLKIKAKTGKVKYKSLKKKNQTLAVSKVITFTKKGQGKMTYTKSKGDKKITINKKTGKITIKKGLKKGTYAVKIKVKAAGNSNYKASKTIKLTIQIKVK